MTMELVLQFVVIVFAGILFVRLWLYEKEESDKREQVNTFHEAIDSNTSYLKFQCDLAKEIHKNKQEIEDMRMGHAIKKEALRLYIDWAFAEEGEYDGQIFKKVGIIIVNPVALRYSIYDPETAKYRGVNVVEEVMKEYEQLKGKNSPKTKGE